jgi:heme/copper-type cytochrome/quinol oxidase subunit 2
MSVTRDAQNSAARAANSKSLELLTRAGFIGYGIVHILFAWIILQVALGGSSAEGDQSGALQTLVRQPFGKVLLVLVAIGLLAMALWQALEAAFGHREDRGRTRIIERIASAGRTVVYLYLAWTAFKVFKDAAASTADSQQQTSEGLMGSTGGRFLLVLAGLALAALGVGLVWYGVKKRFEKHLKTAQMSPSTHKLIQRLGTAGYSAKGVAYGIAGLLFVVAAVTYDPAKARGLDATINAVREQAYGTILLSLIALGVLAFGVYCLFQARYRKV